ncbi:hypothetical protein AAHA92_06276 [Salvia divinorum]|uniref:Secreted protein n=1 Tax=Salvia divinorum TaxID=28513 RepID=A0ABD1I691_SALDI
MQTPSLFSPSLALNLSLVLSQVATPTFAAPPVPRRCVIVTLAASSPAVADIAIHRRHRPSPVPSPASSRLCPDRCRANVPLFSDTGIGSARRGDRVGHKGCETGLPDCPACA